MTQHNHEILFKSHQIKSVLYSDINVNPETIPTSEWKISFQVQVETKGQSLDMTIPQFTSVPLSYRDIGTTLRDWKRKANIKNCSILARLMKTEELKKALQSGKFRFGTLKYSHNNETSDGCIMLLYYEDGNFIVNLINFLDEKLEFTFEYNPDSLKVNKTQKKRFKQVDKKTGEVKYIEKDIPNNQKTNVPIGKCVLVDPVVREALEIDDKFLDDFIID